MSTLLAGHMPWLPPITASAGAAQRTPCRTPVGSPRAPAHPLPERKAQFGGQPRPNAGMASYMRAKRARALIDGICTRCFVFPMAFGMVMCSECRRVLSLKRTRGE
jgi:hypothetical protein